jgi:hypothetical protein
MVSKKCKIEGCNSPVWGNGLCKNHIPKKSLKKTVSKKADGGGMEMKTFFLDVWKERTHYSEVSGKYLGDEALSTYFHHILPKSKYSDAQYDKENIILLTLEEHDQVEMDAYRYEEVNVRRQKLLEKYERTKA